MSPISRRFWKLLHRLGFWLRGRRRLRKLVLDEVAGMPLVVLPDVLHPGLFRTGEMLARVAAAEPLAPGAWVLDLGTGSGVVAVAVARAHDATVVATDVAPEAVRAARINALLNRVDDRVDVRHGDLFAPVAGERFDRVIFNPPFFRGRPVDDYDRAWRSDDVVERFASEVAQHLATGGSALVILSSDGDPAAALELFRAAGLATSIAAERDLGSELLTVHRLIER